MRKRVVGEQPGSGAPVAPASSARVAAYNDLLHVLKRVQLPPPPGLARSVYMVVVVDEFECSTCLQRCLRTDF
eukprot:88535-Prorocentrum_minimum.AAC.1